MRQASSLDLAQLIGDLSLTKKAENIQMFDVRDITSMTDYFLFCSAETEVQVKAIADAIRKGTPHRPWRIEGYENQQWILLDYIDVIVHVFKTTERNFYNLEKLWADAPMKEIQDEDQELPL